MVAALVPVACDSGNGLSTTLPRSATLASLTQMQAATLCDWTNARQGGYGRSVTCLDGTEQTTDADRVSCVGVIPQVGIACPTLTVADVETCVKAIGPMLCEITTNPACGNLAACLETPCLPSIVVPWVLERNTGTPVTCVMAGAFYVELSVNTQAYEAPCGGTQTMGTMQVPVAGPGNYTLVVSLLDSARVDVVPPTPPLTVTVPQSCADVTTIEAVFTLP